MSSLKRATSARSAVEKLRLTLRAPKIRGTLMSAALTYFGFGLSILSAPMLAQALTADGRGRLAAIFVPVQLLAWLGFLGVPRGLSMEAAKIRQVAMKSFVILAGLGIVAFLLSFSIASLFAGGDPDVVHLLRIASLSLVLNGVTGLALDYTLSQGQLVRWNLIRLCSLVLPSVAIIVLFLCDELTLHSAFWAQFAGGLMGVLLGACFVIPTISRNGAEIPWKFSLSFWSASAFDSIGAKLDQLLLAVLATHSDLGVYAVAITCAAAGGALTQAVADVTFSEFVRDQGSGGNETMRRRSRETVIISTATSVILVGAVSMFSEPLFGPTFGNLGTLVGILCIYQTLSDQWRLRAYFDSSRLNAKILGISSALAVCVMFVAAFSWHLAFELDGIAMASAMVLMSIVRLAIRRVLITRADAPAPPRREVQLSKSSEI